MAESAIEPPERAAAQHERPTPPEQATCPETTPAEGPATAEADQRSEQGETVLWTPGFIVVFALTLGLGLSAECLLTNGWLAHFYSGNWPQLAHLAALLLLWLVLLVRGRTAWARLGAIFGCLWACFVGLNLLLNLRASSQPTAVAYLNASGNLSLLGMYLCFATERARAPRWDTWFFALALLGGCGAVLTDYLLTDPDQRSLTTVADAIAALALWLALLIWWLRPACWRLHPGPTFLFGLFPLIILLLSIPGITNSFNNLFFVQVADLCLFLAGLRILQAQRVLS
ncbi:MAG: hypothetical protein IRZ31_08455 [Thermogemmatispora sp.]|uniref:hypothetical protein n=1 Tax=Thermogemmatispora sp. TaxID=1968838 RepID=UPI0026193BB0|nr:hypothetical protein [Thermogemmatispora sp.]MBX5456917.1 hypothetical protein [Thermogemmatispora sp.]